MNKVKIGVFSFAHVHASSYAEALQDIEGAELLGIYDPNRSRGKNAAADFNVEYYQNVESLLSETEGAIVVSENSKHKSMVLKAADFGNDILCEKPIATGLDDAKRMIRRCEEKNVSLRTAFPMRYSPPVISLKGKVQNGGIGEVFGISSTNHGTLDGLPEWFYDETLSGGGAAMDHAVHLIDLFYWILGNKIKEVYAELGTLLHDITVEDCGLLSLEFNNGISATIDCSWSRPKSYPTWGDLKMRVYGSEGVVDMSAFNQKFTVYRDDRGKGEEEYWGTDFDLAMIRDFVRTVQERPLKGSLATGEDGKKALEITLAAYESDERGEPVVI